MPHIIVEHTNDIENVADIVGSLHHNLAGQETVTLEAVKSRSIAVSNAIVGEVQDGSMLHVTVKLLSGRSNDFLAKMTGDLRVVAKSKVAENVSVTVESVELHNESYQK